MTIQNTAIYKQRRAALRALVEKQHSRTGCIVLCAAYETARHRFWQDSTFFYFTGIEQPGCVLVLTSEGEERLYIPAVQGDRAQWVAEVLHADAATAEAWGLDKIMYLGEPTPGYQATPLFTQQGHVHVLDYLRTICAQGHQVYGAVSERGLSYVAQRSVFDRWSRFVPAIAESLVDCAPLVGQLRRKKAQEELDSIRKAVTVSVQAHRAAADLVGAGVWESELQGVLVAYMTACGAREAFPSIVASGKQATILHYDVCSAQLADGELVLFDAGASVDGYAADLSRTYAVSGAFTERQKQVYNAVLAAQQHVAECAKPGMWLRNNAHPERSLQHKGYEILAREGLDRYFVHGIGHFLGLDVHDVGDSAQPLEEGDVITIEPGVYIREEGLGVRIEDNFVITASGAECLSDDLPR